MARLEPQGEIQSQIRRKLGLTQPFIGTPADIALQS